MENQIIRPGGEISGVTGCIAMTACGAKIEDNGILEHTLMEEVRSVAKAERACQWILGDLINYARARFGEKISDWEDATGLTYKYISQLCSTSRNIPMGIRRPGLSFTHHRALADRCGGMSDEQKSMWLQLAEEKRMTVPRFQKSIELGRIATLSDMSPELPVNLRGVENVHPYVNKLFSYLVKSERDGAYDDMDAEDLYEFHHDLLPVVDQVTGVWRRIQESGDEEFILALREDLLKEGIDFLPAGVVDVKTNADGDHE